MEFEWNESKRATNIEKHGIDFVDARAVWRSPHLDPYDTRVVDDELRHLAIGLVPVEVDHDIVVAVVYTWRGDSRRLISARRARIREREDYARTFG